MSTPGWYNDEADPALARWHDGVAWTDHVVDKAAWESAGHEPPPPAELWIDEGPSRANRVRLAVGSAAVVAVLLVTGVALAQGGGGGDDGPTTSTSVRRSDLADDSVGTVGSSIDSVGEAIDPATGLPLYGDGAASGSSGGTTGATAGSKTSSSTKTSNGVTRTESRTESHTSPSVQTNPTSGDKSSVGHSTNTSIKQTPPPTEAPTTTAAPPPTDPTTTTTTSTP